MKQQLEYRIPITDESDNGEVKVKCKPTKLSEAWRLASKELKQIKGAFARDGGYCAAGAIKFYADQDPKYGSYGHFKECFFAFQRNLDSSVSDKNDNQGWSFEDFANKAEELGF